MLLFYSILSYKGIQYYKVRWKGFGPDEDTWEPEEHLFGCKSVLDQYWKKTKQIKKNKVKEIESLSDQVDFPF